MVRYSEAFRELQNQLAISREMVRMESRLKLPLTPTMTRRSHGLKGGVAVLCVAAFEAFLQSAMEERLDRIATLRLEIFAGDLPATVWTHQVFESLNRAMRGHRLAPAADERVDRVPNVARAARAIVSGLIDPVMFSDTQGNPNAKNIRAIFKALGFTDVLVKVKPEFDRRWKAATAATFLEDKLEEIIARRNRVAHNADTGGVASSDLSGAIMFLETLAATLDQELGVCVRDMIAACPRRDLNTTPIL